MTGCASARFTGFRRCYLSCSSHSFAYKPVRIIHRPSLYPASYLFQRLLLSEGLQFFSVLLFLNDHSSSIFLPCFIDVLNSHTLSDEPHMFLRAAFQNQDMTRKLVNDFIAAGRPSSRKQNIEERRAGYVASTVLAGDMDMWVQVRSFEPEDICFWIASPLQSNGPLPAVIYYHGGCFVSGGVATHEKQLRQLAYYGNCHVIAVEYRLAPEHIFPAAHDDALKGADIVWRNASQFGVNSNQITLAGDSAGGHLALVTALLAPATRAHHYRRVRPVVR